jgi:predicted PurR-regulated permease PerM
MRQDKLIGQGLVSVIFTCLILAGAFVVLSPFLLAIIWAAIIATASWGLHQWVYRRCGRRDSLAALCTTLIITVVLVGPTVLLVVFVSQDLVSGTNYLMHADKYGEPVPEWLARLPWVGDMAVAQWQRYLAQPDQLSMVLRETLATKLNVIQGTVEALLLNLSGRLATLVFALWVLFFLYRDGRHLIGAINQIGYKWLDRRWPAYVHQVPTALRAAVNGLIIVGFAEAMLLSLVFWACGVPSAVLFGVATAVLAFVPMAAPVLLAVLGIVMFASGATVGGVVLVALGLLIVMGADYTVRPMLIQGGTQLPFLGILFGIFGGVVTMGVVGLIIGPVMLVLLMVFFREAAIDEENVNLEFDTVQPEPGTAQQPSEAEKPRHRRRGA